MRVRLVEPLVRLSEVRVWLAEPRVWLSEVRGRCSRVRVCLLDVRRGGGTLGAYPIRSRMTRLVCLAALILFAHAAPSSAQPLTVTPNPFDASGSAPLVIRNDTAAPVRFDSLSFTRSVPYSAIGWFIRYTVDTPDGLSGGLMYCEIRFQRPADAGASSGGEPSCGYGTENLFGRVLAPGGRIVFETFNLKCGQCLGAALLDDTMFLFSDGSPTGQPVAIRNGGFSAAEDAPLPAAVSASPNPASGAVRLTLPAASRVRVTDALGREVALRDVPAGGVVEIDVSAWAPGVYVARADVGARSEVVRFVVAR